MNFYQQFKEIKTKEQGNQFKQTVEKVGFSAFNEIVQSLHGDLKKVNENGFEELVDWIKLGKELFPTPVSISPVWENIWQELLTIYELKKELYSQIPLEQRSGEWQVLFDNPMSTETTVCHIGKMFEEATYLTAKYQLTMKRAEVLKLQKVVTSITKNGK